MIFSDRLITPDLQPVKTITDQNQRPPRHLDPRIRGWDLNVQMWWPSVLQHPRAQLIQERIEKERNQRMERNRVLSMERLEQKAEQFTPRRRNTKSTSADASQKAETGCTPERRRSDVSAISYLTPTRDSPNRDARGSVKSSTASRSGTTENTPLRDSATPREYATPPKGSPGKTLPALKGKVRNRDKEGLAAALAQLPEMVWQRGNFLNYDEWQRKNPGAIMRHPPEFGPHAENHLIDVPHHPYRVQTRPKLRPILTPRITLSTCRTTRIGCRRAPSCARSSRCEGSTKVAIGSSRTRSYRRWGRRT